MRKVLASMFVTLDGFIARTNGDMDWNMDIFNDEMGSYIDAQQKTVDTMLLGRITYEMFAGYWTSPDLPESEAGMAEIMNNQKKVVFSRTLDKVSWGKWDNATLVKDNIAEAVTKLKQEPGQNMAVVGSASILGALMQANVIDEIHLLVHPVVIGSGQPLFKDIAGTVKLKLLRTETFKNGVVVLVYAPSVSQ